MAKPTPKYIFQIGPYKYNIFYDAEHILRQGLEVNDGLFGYTEHHSQGIWIDPAQAPDMAAETLLHELLHACFFASGLTVQLADDKEEEVIRCLSPILLDTLRRNPELIEALIN